MKTEIPKSGKIILTKEELQKMREVKKMLDTIIEDFDLNNETENYGCVLNEFCYRETFCSAEFSTYNEQYLEVDVEIVDDDEEE